MRYSLDTALEQGLECLGPADSYPPPIEFPPHSDRCIRSMYLTPLSPSTGRARRNRIGLSQFHWQFDVPQHFTPSIDLAHLSYAIGRTL